MNGALRTNPNDLRPGDPVIDGPKILQRADLVWSKMKLEPGEVLLVKISKHLAPAAKEIQSIVDKAFGKDNDKVVLFVAEDIEFTKVTP